MAHDIPELDLDDADPGGDGHRAEGPGRIPWRERRRQWSMRVVSAPRGRVVLLAVVIALVAAGLTRAGDGLWNWRSRRADVAVFVSVPGDGYVGGASGGDDTYTFQSGIRVINAGPLPIKLGRISARTRGITLNGDAHGKVVPVGTAQPVDVDLVIDCRTYARGATVDLRVSVRTADGGRRSSTRPLVVRGTLWDQMVESCAAPDAGGQ